MLTSQARLVRALDGQRALSCLHHPTEDSRDHQRQVLLVHSHRWHWASGFQVHGHQLPVGILGWADPLLKSQTSHGRSLTNPAKTLPYKENPGKSLKQSQCLHLNPCDPIKKHQKTATISTQPHYLYPGHRFLKDFQHRVAGPGRQQHEARHRARLVQRDAHDPGGQRLRDAAHATGEGVFQDMQTRDQLLLLGFCLFEPGDVQKLKGRG